MQEAEQAPRQSAAERAPLWAPPAIGPVVALVNPKAGSVGPDGPDRLAALLADLRIDAHVIVGGTEALPEAADALQRRQALLVLGGDGTARAAAELLGPGGAPFAPLPGGTMNMLPRAIYGEAPWPDVVRALAAGCAAAPLPGAVAEGQAFFVAALFGSPALMARAREAVREGRLLVALKRMRRALGYAFGARVRVALPGARLRSGEAIAALCPSLTGREGELEWAALDPADALEAARLSVKALMGAGWRDDPAAATAFAAEGRVRGRAIVPAILDGEPTAFDGPVRVRFVPQAARVLRIAEPTAPA